MLELSSITKCFNQNCVLNHISFSLPKGLHLLTGPNGAGKTTLLRIIAGVIAPAAGQVSLNGIFLHGDSVKFKAHMGYLPQKFGVYPEMTAQDFLRYFADLKGIPASIAASRVEEVMDIAKITSFHNKTLRDWTKGMRQKVGIAQGLLNDPDLLLMDEPLSGLDPEERDYFCNLFSQVSSERIVLLSTHIISELTALADSIMLLHNEKLQFKGPIPRMLDAASGSVWLATLSESEWIDRKNKWVVSSLRSDKGLYEVRIISDVRPEITEVRSVEPTLEEAYIYLVSKGYSE
ncbi:ABC-type multidrug transport system ATPase subunit [Sporomusaceae bacterium BoRhaA]|uniref:ATP-binding cassette domain-containing protein n=1 Tax=Pelorhabdus rhamnosifermentans TaxID=2772457 RepID=UPI001C06200D|nr:ATP-binding cassette domain-containing protein [Pelorhabdus rhamnosifermentans]MBU2702843.1 ABC-type multidrug transport system ATPase subunit [Pelorhabdus rhamnosifermentans]